jgi:hypothetical protein
MSDDRRRSPRIEIMGRLQGRAISLDVPVLVREISLGGMSIESALVFDVGDVHEFLLTLGDESQVPLRARVMRSQEETTPEGKTIFATGLQFVDEDEPIDSDSVPGIIDRLK